MKTIAKKKRSLWGPLALLLLGATLLAQMLGALPAGIGDFLLRAWPVLIVIASTLILLEDRSPRLRALGISAALLILIGIAAAAYVQRTQVKAAGQSIEIAQTIPDDDETLEIQIDANIADMTIRPGTADHVMGMYNGSSALDFDIHYESEGTKGTLTLRERSRETLPALESVGLSSLNLALPPDRELSLTFSTQVGDITADLTGLNVQSVNANATFGSLTLTMPEEGLVGGDIGISFGDVTLDLPPSMALRLTLSRGPLGVTLDYPQYSALKLLVGDVLETDGWDQAIGHQVALNLSLLSGHIQINQ